MRLSQDKRQAGPTSPWPTFAGGVTFHWTVLPVQSIESSACQGSLDRQTVSRDSCKAINQVLSPQQDSLDSSWQKGGERGTERAIALVSSRSQTSNFWRATEGHCPGAGQDSDLYSPDPPLCSLPRARHLMSTDGAKRQPPLFLRENHSLGHHACHPSNIRKQLLFKGNNIFLHVCAKSKWKWVTQPWLDLFFTLQGKKGRPGDDGAPGPKGQKVCGFSSFLLEKCTGCECICSKAFFA